MFKYGTSIKLLYEYFDQVCNIQLSLLYIWPFCLLSMRDEAVYWGKEDTPGATFNPFDMLKAYNMHLS